MASSYLEIFIIDQMKRNNPQTSKSCSCRRNRSSSMHVIGKTCFSESFIIPCDKCVTFFFHKSSPLFWRFFQNAMSLLSFFERSPYFIRYLHNNSAMLIPMYETTLGTLPLSLLIILLTCQYKFFVFNIQYFVIILIYFKGNKTFCLVRIFSLS